ncbi:phosphoglycolate phosphatase [Neisseria leonii]|uniref:phosphoglycolate phosphatase n=1 Tax=Neisseria leonii TaxID=2995413 RepID=UPI00237C19D4|nr:phosphoglycolate phosphatase [Neisseria sp. 3986]MDD9326333.1 phosphoglycolate phosphatase [Neisseria sp. 3986]
MDTAINRLQAVIFDLDGTLCDSVADLAASANAMRAALNLAPLPQDTIESYVGDGVGVLVHRSLTADYCGRAEPALWEQGFVSFVRHYAEHIADATRLYPETEAGLQLLKSLGIPLAVVTNKNEVLAVKLLKALGLADYFTIVLGGDSLPEKKPSPAPLLHVAEILGIAPQEMMMVGDSANDILAAKAAGCLSVGVTFGYGDMAELSQNPATKPDWLIGALPEIYENLKPQKDTETD